jgi:hypothetical protein
MSVDHLPAGRYRDRQAQGSSPVRLDADLRLLDALQRDGRASYASLARAVAMSPSAVANACAGWRSPASSPPTALSSNLSGSA